jgi:hypothetical protein
LSPSSEPGGQALGLGLPSIPLLAHIVQPGPGLTPAQARAIAVDYGIRGRSTSLRVRRALLFYALKRLGLDVAPDARPVSEQHIVLLNRAEVDAAVSRRPDA